MKQLNIRLTDQQYDDLHLLAGWKNGKRIMVSEIVREALQEYFERRKGEGQS